MALLWTVLLAVMRRHLDEETMLLAESSGYVHH